jgi:hypothetical protein
MERVESQLATAKEYTNRDTDMIDRCRRAVEDMLGADEAKKLFTPAEVESYRKQFADIQKFADQKAADAKLADAKKLVDETEKEFPEMLKQITTRIR